MRQEEINVERKRIWDEMQEYVGWCGSNDDKHGYEISGKNLKKILKLNNELHEESN